MKLILLPFYLLVLSLVWGMGMAKSKKPKSDRYAACKEPMDPGKCKGAQPKYYWDVDARKCQKFSYGGCDGNGNRFDSKKACEKKCIGMRRQLDKKDGAGNGASHGSGNGASV